MPRLGCHWTHFEGKTPYLQRCFAEAGNSSVKTLWGEFLQTCVPRVSGVSAAISPDVQCPVSTLASGACCCSWHLVLSGCVQALSEFQTDRCTSTQPGTQQSPLLSGDCAPAPGQHWDPGGGMGCGSGTTLEHGTVLELGAVPADPHPCDATQLRRAPMPLSHPVAGWRAAHPFSDPSLSVCLF